jgi:hypothetical protein
MTRAARTDGALACVDGARRRGVRALVHDAASRGTVHAVAGMLAADVPTRAADGGWRCRRGERLARTGGALPAAAARRAGPASEPVHVPDALREACGSCGCGPSDPALAGVRCEVTVAPDAPPALARHDRVRLAVWALLVAAADGGADPVCVAVGRDAEGQACVRVHGQVPTAASPAADASDAVTETRAAAWLAAPHGTVARDATGWTLRLPSLLGRA